MINPQLDLSVIVPTCDMAAHLPALLASFERSGLRDVAREILIVDDGSTDDTPLILNELKSPYRVIRLDRNQGRFAARLAGANAAAAPHLLFLDTRTTPGPGFAAALTDALARGCAMCTIRIDVTKSLFNLYWERTHAFIFRRQRARERAGFEITAANYAEFVTGTGGFLCEADVFRRACASFHGEAPRSDDTALLARIAAERPIFVRDDFFVYWEPRQDLKTFLGRLIERGPGFAEYHLLTKRGLYFYVLLFCAIYAAATVAAWVRGPTWGPSMTLAIPLGLILTSLAFARGPVEFIRLAPLHLLVCLTAAVSIVRGVFVCLGDRRRGTP